MEGHYWTDRGTRGTMNISARQKKLKDTLNLPNPLINISDNTVLLRLDNRARAHFDIAQLLYLHQN